MFLYVKLCGLNEQCVKRSLIFPLCVMYMYKYDTMASVDKFPIDKLFAPKNTNKSNISKQGHKNMDDEE